MKKKLLLFIILKSLYVSAQVAPPKDGDYYRDDQIYLSIVYNMLIDVPEAISTTGVSFSINAGFIRDIPLNSQGNFGLGIGIGYENSKYNQNIKISENLIDEIEFGIQENFLKNNYNIKSFDIPIEIRWRTSTATKYKFWRIYGGIKFSYNFYNKYVFNGENSEKIKLKNIDKIEKFSYGSTLSLGYGDFNVYFYYPFSKIFNQSYIGSQKIETKPIRLGFIFYLL